MENIKLRKVLLPTLVPSTQRYDIVAASVAYILAALWQLGHHPHMPQAHDPSGCPNVDVKHSTKVLA